MLTFSGLRRAGAACVLVSASQLAAQDSSLATPHDSTRDNRDAPARRSTQAAPFEFSGVIFANYQYGGLAGARATNRFEVDRAYLTFRATPGEHFGVRITGDVYQQRDTTRDDYYRGWALRAKYAYAEYDFIRGEDDALTASVKLGLLQTVVIENEEEFWIRGLSPVAVDQNGFFASADAGVATTFTFPGKLGELYATITNGPGYTSRETDRFKDYAMRLSLTPFAGGSGFWKQLTLSPWYSSGDRASDFAEGRGTVRQVSAARRKDRAGLFLGLRDPRIVLGAHVAQRWDIVEDADTTRDVAPSAVERTGRVISLHTIVRPLAFTERTAWPIAIVLRADHIEPDVDRNPYARNYIAGLSWEFNRRTSLTLDYQRQSPHDGSTAPDRGVVFLHLIAGF